MLLISCTSCKRKKYTLSADKFEQNAILLQFHVNFFFFEKTLDKTIIMWYYINVADRKQHKGYGEVSERFKELVLKTSDSSRSREFESRPLRHTFNSSAARNIVLVHLLELYSSGEEAHLLRV